MKHKIIVLDDLVFPEESSFEAFVENCEHCSDNTIHIANNPKHYERIFKKHGEIAVMVSVLSHEVLHNVILKIDNNQTSRALDISFGVGKQYKEEYHGLCRLRYRLREANKLNRVRGNKNRGR